MINRAINHFRDVPENKKCSSKSDVNDFPGIVKSSNLFLSHPNTSVYVVEGLEGAVRNKSRNKSLPGRPENHDFSSKSCFLARFWT